MYNKKGIGKKLSILKKNQIGYRTDSVKKMKK